MSTDLDHVVQVNGLPGANGINVQDVAALGAQLTALGLTKLQVQGLLAQMQKMALQTAMNTLGDVLEEVRKVQEARMWDILNRINTMPTMAGYVSRNHVVQIVTNVSSMTPRQ